MADDTISVREFATLGNYELGWAYRLCWMGTVAAEKVGGRWRVSRVDALSYIDRQKAVRERREADRARREEARAWAEERDRRWQEVMSRFR